MLCTLSLQVFRQRLEQEHGASVIVTAPTVPCRIMLPGGETVELQNPAEFPTNTKIAAGAWHVLNLHSAVGYLVSAAA